MFGKEWIGNFNLGNRYLWLVPPLPDPHKRPEKVFENRVTFALNMIRFFSMRFPKKKICPRNTISKLGHIGRRIMKTFFTCKKLKKLKTQTKNIWVFESAYSSGNAILNR